MTVDDKDLTQEEVDEIEAKVLRIADLLDTPMLPWWVTVLMSPNIFPPGPERAIAIHLARHEAARTHNTNTQEKK